MIILCSPGLDFRGINFRFCLRVYQFEFQPVVLFEYGNDRGETLVFRASGAIDQDLGRVNFP